MATVFGAHQFYASTGWTVNLIPVGMFIDPTTVVDTPIYRIMMVLYCPGNFISSSIDIVIGHRRHTRRNTDYVSRTVYDNFSSLQKSNVWSEKKFEQNSYFPVERPDSVIFVAAPKLFGTSIHTRPVRIGKEEWWTAYVGTSHILIL